MKAVEAVIAAFGQIDILINNAAELFPQESIEQIYNTIKQALKL